MRNKNLSRLLALLSLLLLPFSLISEQPTTATKFIPNSFSLINSASELQNQNDTFARSAALNLLPNFNEKKALTIGAHLNFLLPTNSYSLSVEEIPTAITKFSTLKGLQYYSKSKRRYRILFEELYLIPFDENNKNLSKISRLKDPTSVDSKNLPQKYRFYQKDSTLGESLWNCELKKIDDSFLLTFTNESDLKMLGISVLKPNRFSLIFQIKIENSDLKIDGYTLAFFDSNFMKETLQNGLANRLYALSLHIAKAILNQDLEAVVLAK